MQRHLILFITFFVLPYSVFAASFSHDLFFGIYNDPEVTRLQEFLRSEGVYDGPVTGNFLTLTREGVKNFQRREGIEPVLGYFGPLTRARANAILREREGSLVVPSSSVGRVGEGETSADLISSLTAQIQALQKQIEELRVKLAAEAAVVPPSAPPPPKGEEEKEMASPPQPQKPAALEITGSGATSLPETATTPLKLGDITFYNNTGANIEILQLVIKITDDMNSQLNRGRGVFFLIRAGTTTFDAAVSKTPFTFLSKDPRGEPIAPNVSTLNLSYPIKLKPGEKRVDSLWIENLELVLNGTLMVESKEVLATETVAASGSFKFTLTK